MADVLKLHQDPDFQASDVPTPNDFDKLKEKLKDYEPPLPGLEAGEGWQSVTVDISVPMGKQPGSQIGSTTKFSVPHLHHRSITELIQKIIRTNPDAKDFHLYPFEEYVTRNDATERLFGELYTSDAFLDEFRKVRAEPPEPDCNLEKIVLGLQFWSDATLLANFGTHKLWPVYMYIGNQSKYVRAKPTSDGGWDVAYIPELPDDIEEVLQQLPTKSAHQPLLTHCRRELFQNVLLQLLDEDFYNAYKHGMVIEFPDGIKRRVFPRILTWSADYPEKCLLATIRENGRCPCPRCFIKKSEIRNLGTKRDQRMRLQRRRKDNSWRRVMIESVRRNLYIFGKAIAGQFVNKRLDEFSMTPNENALSQRLQEFGLDYHEILPVDLLHEIEIGEWKRLLLHFIRMLYSREPGDVWVEQMNARFRAIPIFGKDTIRRLPQNVAGMKRLAARDYEDILQVSITVFEDLFGTEHSEAITKLIYVMAEWHCLAKLRLHSDSTLKHLDTVTTVLGKELRNFADKIAPSFNTKETVSETTARARQREKNQKTLFGQVLASSAARVKKYTLDRYKLHALGDYTSTIRRLGTTDSYSTYIGEARHRIKKQDYRKTNKRKFKLQMMATKSRHPAISQIDASAIGGHRPGHTDGTNNEPLVPHLRYDISKRADSTFHIGSFVQASATDRAVKHFKSQLSDHVLCRLRGIPYSGNSLELPQDCSALRIQNNHIHCHPTMRLNYTTYDVRRATDHVKPYLKFNRKAPHCQRSETRDRSTVMLSTSDNQQSSSGFLYARVLGIFHVLASEVGRTTQEIKRIDLLWVKWFSDVPGWKGGWETRRLDRVWFPPDSEDMGNYGFVDPADVVRACHLPPVFSCGEDAERQQSIASDEGGDYKFYDVNRFVDRDMYMRYFGGGVGHVDRNQVARTLVDTADNHNGNLDEDEDDEDEDFEDQIDFERLDAILEGVDDEEGEVEDDGEEDEEDSEPDCDREEEEEEDEDDDENIDNDYED
ncbi:hypothetical protein SISSUDRAFT_988644 [Sistotremastrum suecicum HHB10207 ss-3]|uniref:Transposase domain-containing protein n=1 Tax=Sistotremastrum suecicum HHB10207 ss-3 TaxID=1314776 RepID=A0A166BUM2_9AGAM|nr:hypothetical protein SISSUDRAFT_988644 [Sistotremastrum suecicum HHB10207 ss-3]